MAQIRDLWVKVSIPIVRDHCISHHNHPGDISWNFTPVRIAHIITMLSRKTWSREDIVPSLSSMCILTHPLADPIRYTPLKRRPYREINKRQNHESCSHFGFISSWNSQRQGTIHHWIVKQWGLEELRVLNLEIGSGELARWEVDRDLRKSKDGDGRWLSTNEVELDVAVVLYILLALFIMSATGRSSRCGGKIRSFTWGRTRHHVIRRRKRRTCSKRLGLGTAGLHLLVGPQ
jgi:hypothetical protein